MDDITEQAVRCSPVFGALTSSLLSSIAAVATGGGGRPCVSGGRYATWNPHGCLLLFRHPFSPFLSHPLSPSLISVSSTVCCRPYPLSLPLPVPLSCTLHRGRFHISLSLAHLLTSSLPHSYSLLSTYSPLFSISIQHSS